MFTLSASSPNIHEDLKNSLRVRGTKVSYSVDTRPQTMATLQNDISYEEGNSENGTVTIKRTERQTAVKIESLERRLQANERNRRELEGELEKLKRKLQKVQEENSELQIMNEDYKTKLEEIDLFDKEHLVQTRSNVTQMEKLDTELQLLFTEHRNLKEQIAATLLEKQNDLNSFELSSNNILQLVTRISEARKKVEKQLQGAQENLQETHSQLIKSQEHVAKLLQQVDFATKSNLERLDIQKEELEIETETVSHMRINLKKMEEEAAERTKNLETMTAELRWLKKQKLDFEMNERSNRILLKSLETERKSLIETLSLLLGYEMAVDEAEIKKKIRQLQKELENNKTVQIKLERDYQMIEEQLLDQAKQQRNALYRARTAEEEHCILEEKVESLLHEIKASELEIKEKEGKIEQFQAMFRKINSTIGLQTENGPKELIDRIEDLAIYESLLQKTRPNPTTLHKLASTTKPNVHSVAHAFCSKSPWERWDQRLFTAVTLESIKAADNEKLLLRKRLNEREKKIRELEKERKEVKSQKTSRNNEERVHAKPRTDDNKLKDTNVEALKNH